MGSKIHQGHENKILRISESFMINRKQLTPNNNLMSGKVTIYTHIHH